MLSLQKNSMMKRRPLVTLSGRWIAGARLSSSPMRWRRQRRYLIGFLTERGWTFEVEDAERDEVILNH
jgi:hypothetical protein